MTRKIFWKRQVRFLQTYSIEQFWMWGKSTETKGIISPMDLLMSNNNSVCVNIRDRLAEETMATISPLLLTSSQGRMKASANAIHA